jgi:hypothetical protein
MKKYESYFNSPFRVEGLVERQYVTKADEQIWEAATGELYVAKKIDKSKVHLTDPVSYTKLFVDNREMLLKLSGTGLRVLVYAICTIRPLSQTAVLHIPDIQVETGISAPVTIRTGICELIEAGIIAQKLGSNIEFWINPNVFFNGNRLRLI